MKEKVCCFAGHRFLWRCLGIDSKLLEAIESLIINGYTIFYDGDCGAFDEKCRNAVLQLKVKYPHIKLIKVLKYYHHKNSKYGLNSCYDGSIYPDLENIHFKAKIIKRNEWIVDHSDIVVCHIENYNNSGAYKMVKYAQKKNKEIIFI